MDFPTGAGATGGPIAPDHWKRAVYRSAPRNFFVKILCPEKQGSSHSYGLRVCPIKGDNASIVSRSTSSGGSAASMGEYDIWRKWEDCLWFQEILEVEYTQMAREKRSRLAAGKGVKKNGVYIHSDHAASFESLPPGPDPLSVAQDIHEFVPKLTKKGTLFRASQATIDQRFEELYAMIDCLFRDDVPTLLKEIRATRTFTDFFGFWRRDHDLERKGQTQKESSQNRPRASLSPSIFSSYFSASSPALSDMFTSSSKGKQPEIPPLPIRASTHSDSSSSEGSIGPPKPRPIAIASANGGQLTEDLSSTVSPTPSRAASSWGSSTSPSLPSTPVAPSRQLSATVRQHPIIVTQELPIRFGHNPEVLNNERPTSVLQPLPEDRELSSSPTSAAGADSKVWPRRRAGSTASEVNRRARIYEPLPSPSGLPEYSQPPSERTTPSPSRCARYSWQTTHSSASGRAASYLAELDVDYHLPPNPEYGHQPRASICSMASFMTDTSVDAVVPRYQGHPTSRSAASGRRRSRPLSLPEEPDQWVDHLGHEQGDDLLDAYFYGTIKFLSCRSGQYVLKMLPDLIRPQSPTPSSRPETPAATDASSYMARPEQQYAHDNNSAYAYADRRSSFATSVSSGSTTSTADPTSISIKAMHEDNIIVLRVPRHLSYDGLRQKLYDKFLQTGRSPISESFAMALLVPPCTGSPSSPGSIDTKQALLHFISCQDEWDEVITLHGSKIILRIIGSRE
ncbi:hypothetical protein BU15DRAFT_62488 [Melanogaster broomeanus]|nr:hypothetical protein BU15DRAFT_62488 [Melanogaster broomeanus]